MKKLKSIIALLLCAILLLQPITACAATKEIEVNHNTLNEIKDVLEICKYWLAIDQNRFIKFDSKTKTARASNYIYFHNDSFEQTLTDVKSIMKSYFGDDKTDFSIKRTGKLKIDHEANDLFLHNNSTVIPMVVEFGEENPLLVVKKILKTGKDTFKISVISMSLYREDNNIGEHFYNGEYEIGLKAGNYKFGYIITSIKKK